MIKFLPFKFLFSILSCALVTSCASYKVSPLEDSIEAIEYKQHSLSSSETSLEWVVFQDSELVKSYYSRDLLKLGIVPAKFVIANNDEDAVIELDPNLMSLTDQQGTSYDALSIDVAIDRARFSQGQSAAWFIGFGIIGAAISASNVSKANTALGEDYRIKALDSQLIQPNTSATGTVFFSVDSSVTTLDELSIAVPLSDSFGDQEIALLKLSGPIEIGSSGEQGQSTDSRFTDDGDPLTPSAD